MSTRLKNPAGVIPAVWPAAADTAGMSMLRRDLEAGPEVALAAAGAGRVDGHDERLVAAATASSTSAWVTPRSLRT